MDSLVYQKNMDQEIQAQERRLRKAMATITAAVERAKAQSAAQKAQSLAISRELDRNISRLATLIDLHQEEPK